jgi:hypothetical protein
MRWQSAALAMKRVKDGTCTLNEVQVSSELW